MTEEGGESSGKLSAAQVVSCALKPYAAYYVCSITNMGEDKLRTCSKSALHISFLDDGGG